mgnify:CR=1 FL=1
MVRFDAGVCLQSLPRLSSTARDGWAWVEASGSDRRRPWSGPTPNGDSNEKVATLHGVSHSGVEVLARRRPRRHTTPHSANMAADVAVPRRLRGQLRMLTGSSSVRRMPKIAASATHTPAAMMSPSRICISAPLGQAVTDLRRKETQKNTIAPSNTAIEARR